MPAQRRILIRGRATARMLAVLACIAAQLPAFAAPSERMVEVEKGVNVRLVESGPHSDKAPVVLITGWGMNADIWAEQAARLAADRRVVTFDPRAQGKSTKVAHGITPEQRARDLQAILEMSNIEKAVLVGWSQGVQDVAAYIREFGTAKVARVVLVDAAVAKGAASIIENSGAAADQMKLLGIFNAYPAAYAEGMIEAIISRPLDPETKERLIAGILETPNAIASAALVADLFTADRTDAIAKLDRPTLVVASAKSSELDDMRKMAEDLPNGRIEIIDDAAHAVFIDQPDRFAVILKRFLDGPAESDPAN